MGLIIAGSTSGTTTIDATAIAGTGTLTLPTGTDTLVGKATTDTLTNKTLTAPVLSGTITGTYTLASPTLTAPALGTPASGNLANCTGAVVASEAYVYIRDEKSSGTGGGDFNSGAWRTRTLNTVVNDASSIATLSSNQITLAAGTYRFRASAAGILVGRNKIRLQNTTDASTISVGTNQFCDASYAVDTRSLLSGRFTIGASKALEVQHRSSDSRASNGFGVDNSFSVVEVYAEIEFWKEV